MNGALLAGIRAGRETLAGLAAPLAPYYHTSTDVATGLATVQYTAGATRCLCTLAEKQPLPPSKRRRWRTVRTGVVVAVLVSLAAVALNAWWK